MHRLINRFVITITINYFGTYVPISLHTTLLNPLHVCFLNKNKTDALDDDNNNNIITNDIRNACQENSTFLTG